MNLHTYAALTAFLISALTYRKWRGTAFRFFPFFLLFIAAASLSGLFGHTDRGPAHGWVAAVIAGIALLFYAFVFSHALKKPSHGRLIQYFMLAVPGLVLADLLLHPGPWQLQNCPMAIGSVVMVILSCLYFYELLLDPVQEKPRKDPMFWFSAGILFFYLGTLGQDLLSHYILLYAGEPGRKLFLNINNNLILILYSCFIAGLLCKRNLQRSLSQ